MEKRKEGRESRLGSKHNLEARMFRVVTAQTAQFCSFDCGDLDQIVGQDGKEEERTTTR